MNKILNQNDGRFISYKQYKSKSYSPINIVFLHGMMSHMNSRKANHLYNLCVQHDFNFLTFDNYGHGSSHGRFVDQTITSWLVASQTIIEYTSPLYRNIVVGSSLGGWLAILLALNNNSHVAGIIGLAPAPDFTERLIWNRMNDKAKNIMVDNGYIDIGNNYCNSKYRISHNLIVDARKYLLLDNLSVDISCPIAVIHGTQDKDVPYEISIDLINKVQSKNAYLKLLKDADHKLVDHNSLSHITYTVNAMVQHIS